MRNAEQLFNKYIAVYSMHGKDKGYFEKQLLFMCEGVWVWWVSAAIINA